MSFIYYNNDLIDQTDVLTTNNRAFRYGDGLYESIWYSEGFIPFLTEHLNRLQHGMKLLGYNKCSCVGEDKISQNINKLCSANEITGGARIRLTVFRKDGGLYAPESDDFDFIIEATQLAHAHYKLNTKGLIIGIAKSVRKYTDALSEIKSTNALQMVLAAREAKKNKWDDALLLNSNNSIADATSSNVFIVSGDSIFTPPIEDGALNGIMRQQLAQLIKQSKYKLRVKSLYIKDLENADEIFFTNAIRGIIWVVGYEKKRYFNHASKELLKLLITQINLRKAKK